MTAARRDSQLNDIRTSLPGISVHVLGPSRDPEQLKRLDPPTSAHWLVMQQTLDAEPASDSIDSPTAPLFEETYSVTSDQVSHEIGTELASTLATLNLQALIDEPSELLAAASILERSVNNTSIFSFLT
jgi:hypothetical protein